MRIFFIRAFPYLAFLGTAIGTVVGTQQVNASLLMVLTALVLTLALGDLARLPYRRIQAITWFMMATIPGTVLFLLRGGPPLVPITQYVGILACWYVVWNIFRHLKYSPEDIFSIYLRCALVCAFVGVLQQVGYLMRIEALYDLRWVLIGAAEVDVSGTFLRVNSLFTEPSYFAAFLMPALYFSILRLTGTSKTLSVGSSLLCVLALVCTFSTIGYIGLLLCVLFALRLTVRNTVLGLLLVAALLGIASYDPAISARLASIPSALKGDLQGDENLSAAVNGLNLSISNAMLSDRPIAGMGLGAYRVYSMDYLENLTAGNEALVGQVNGMLEQITMADGGTMYLRLPTELGLGGCAILAWLLRRGRGLPRVLPHHDIAKAALLFILVFSLRSGQLVRFDFVFFCGLYSLVCFQMPLAWAKRRRLHVHQRRGTHD